VYYYTVVLLHSSAPLLTYESETLYEEGRVVTVLLKSKPKEGVIVSLVEPPSFKTTPILEKTLYCYKKKQMALARFIASYYFSSLGEALGLLHPFLENPPPLASFIEPQREPLRLSSSQYHAYESLLRKKRALLFGVTGAGKTEVFIALMLKVLKEGKSSIFLMPEISLTPQMYQRLRVYFGEYVALWHSQLSKKKKEEILLGIAQGKIRLIAGARSALFVPLPRLGLIVVDEEHDESYKAMTRPRYHARDVALFMGKSLDIPVFLASATPSVGSYYKYDVVSLPQAYRQGEKSYRFVSGNGITSEMIEALRQCYLRGEQSLLFLPTRGSFKYLYCQQCGKTHQCPYCSVGMALHRNSRQLRCHYCQFREPIVEVCQSCGYSPLSSERIGTQEAMAQISEAIEGLVIEQFDKDTIRTNKALKEALKRVASGQSHLLLGTQMLSKGHDYATITLSIILGLDYLLGMADYRARERAMSLFVQIAGRSGRGGASEVIVQTNDPAFFQAHLENYEGFIKEELLFLEMAEYPPFAHLARILISHKQQASAEQITHTTVTALKACEEIEIVGAGKAPIERIANKFRFHILLRSSNRKALLKALHRVASRAIEIDMDPLSFS